MGKLIWLLAGFLILSSLNVNAATYDGVTYGEVLCVNEGGDGSAPGTQWTGVAFTDATKCFDLSQLATAGNWGDGANKITAGDAVVLLDDGGTHTAALSVLASGTSGSPITIRGEIGTVATINMGAASANLSLKSYVTIGPNITFSGHSGTAISIENNTSVYTGLIFTGLIFVGGGNVFAISSSQDFTNCEFKNITAATISAYFMYASATAGHVFSGFTIDNVDIDNLSNGMYFVGLSSSTIKNCTIVNMAGATPIIRLIRSSDNQVYSNSFTTIPAASGIVIYAGDSVGSPSDRNLIHDNSFDDVLQAIRTTNSPTTLHAAANLNDNQIYNNTIANGGEGIYVKLSVGTLVYNNTISNMTDAGTEGYGIAVQTSPGTKIYGNTISVPYNSGIEIWGSNVDLTEEVETGPAGDCEVYNNSVSGATRSANISAIKAQKDAIDNCFIHNNIIYGNTVGVRLGCISSNVRFVNNTLYDNDMAINIVKKTTGVVGTSGQGTSIINNIISGSVDYSIGTSEAAEDKVLEAHTNNIYYQTANTDHVINFSGTVYTAAQVTNFEESALTVDPLLVSATDFHLQGASPAKAAGVNLGSDFTDFAGVSLPTPYGWPIGAYGYNSFGGSSGSFSGSVQ